MKFATSSLAILESVVDDIRMTSDAPLMIHSPGGLPLGAIRRRVPYMPAHSRSQTKLLKKMSRAVDALVAATPNAFHVPENELVLKAGGPHAAASPLFEPSDISPGYSHPTAFGPVVAHSYADVVGDLKLLANRKVVLVDFDNTLWDGVMAEGAVTQWPERQHALLDLKNAGIVLVALSKNDPTSIRWSELVLSEEDFALVKINWLPKPDNVSAAAAELNLSPTSFILLDDNPVERALVVEHVPGVAALDPNERSTWSSLRRWLDLPSTSETAEARQRTAMYREAAARRRALSGPLDYDAMMRSLSLSCTVRPAAGKDIERLSELVQRTNQFNTTTRRLDRAEIKALLDDPDTGVYVATLKDRFGDLGVVATALFNRATRCFDAVIMSCRAMGFGLELALLRRVMDHEGTGVFRGLFIPTDRNAPAADLFHRAGFESSDDRQWQLDHLEPWPEVPGWFA